MKLKSPIFANVALALASLSFGLLFVEGTIRVLGLAPSATAEGGQGLKEILQFDPVLQTKYKPNTSTRITSPYGEFDVVYQINELGLRDDPIPTKSNKEYRVLVLGNSFVEGWGANLGDGFVKAAARVSANKNGGKQIRFVSGGISGYGAAQSYLLAKNIFDAVDPDMVVAVVVGTMVNSDFKFLKAASLDDAGVATGLSADALLSGGAAADTSTVQSDFLTMAARHSAVARLIAKRQENRIAMDRIIGGDTETDLLAAYRSDAHLLETMYAPTLLHVKALAQFVRGKGKQFVLVHLPMAFQVSATEWDRGRGAYRLDDRVYGGSELAMVNRFCVDQQLTCMFADEVIKAAAQRGGERRLFFRYDFHLTPAGNSLVGEWLGTELSQLWP